MAANHQNPLYRSIVRTTALYCLLELIGFMVLGLAYHFPLAFFVGFSAAQVLFHLLILVFLLYMAPFFYLSASGKPLLRVNAANKVTLLRISMVPSLLFLMLASAKFAVGPVLFPVMALTFLTDLIDGRISRARNEVTFIGRILDSVSDYALLLVIAIVYFVFNLLNGVLFWLIIARLAFQSLGMLTLLVVHKRVEPQPTVFGKITVATIMVLFILEPVRLLLNPDLSVYLGYLEYVAALIIVVSMLDKGWYFFKNLAVREPGPARFRRRK